MRVPATGIRAADPFRDSNINPYIFELILHLSNAARIDAHFRCARRFHFFRKNTMLRTSRPLYTHPHPAFVLKSNLFDY